MRKYGNVAEQTRKNIIDAFWNIYKTKDVEKITIIEICKNANYDRTTFYRYFDDINDILNKIEDEIIDNIKISIKKRFDNNPRIYFESFKKFSDTSGEYIVTFYEKGNRHFCEKFKELVKSDVYTYLNFNIKDEDMKNFLYEFVFSSAIISYSYWYKHPNIMSLESFVKLLHGMVLNGSNTIISYMKKD